MLGLISGITILLLGISTIAVWWEHEHHLDDTAESRLVRVGRPGITVTRAEFPHGLRCGHCTQLIRRGHPYWSVPDSATSSDLIEILVCLQCANAEVPA